MSAITLLCTHEPSSLGTGVALLPMMLVGAALTPFSARIAERLGARVLITGGLVLMTAG